MLTPQCYSFSMGNKHAAPKLPTHAQVREFLHTYGIRTNDATVDRFLWSYENAVDYWGGPATKVPSRQAGAVHRALALVLEKLTAWPALGTEDERLVIEQVWARAGSFMPKAKGGEKVETWHQALFLSLVEDLETALPKDSGHWHPDREKLKVDTGVVAQALLLAGVDVGDRTLRGWADELIHPDENKRLAEWTSSLGNEGAPDAPSKG